MTTILDAPPAPADLGGNGCPNPTCIAGTVRRPVSFLLFRGEPATRVMYVLDDCETCDGTTLDLNARIGEPCDHHGGTAVGCIWCDATNVVLWPAGMPPTYAQRDGRNGPSVPPGLQPGDLW